MFPEAHVQNSSKRTAAFMLSNVYYPQIEDFIKNQLGEEDDPGPSATGHPVLITMLPIIVSPHKNDTWLFEENWSPEYRFGKYFLLWV